MIGSSELGAPGGEDPIPAPADPRRAARDSPSGVEPRRSASPVVVAILVLALAVQVFVWGRAPVSGTGGSLLPGLRWAFGTPYAAALLALELGFCLWLRRRAAAEVVVVTAAVADLVFWIAHLAGARFALAGAASMTAAFGAVALAAALWWRRPPASRLR